MPLTLVAARETADGERRTPLVPETAKKFAALGAKLRLESNASLESHFLDSDYADTEIKASLAETYAGADVILRVTPPSDEEIAALPDGAILIFSAHGVSQAVRNEAKSRDLTVFDATCPLVTKVHMEVARASRRGEESILIGHAGHPEVEGTMGQYSNPEGGMYLVESPEDVFTLNVKNEDRLSFMTQTTLSVDDTSDVIDALRQRFPKIVGPRKDDICYATTNRQEAVRALAEQADVVLVVGSKNSSNSNRLAELAQRMGKAAFLIDDATDIQEAWVKTASCVGVTAGASAPDILVQNVITRLQELGGGEAVPLEGREENIVFEVPKELRIDAREVE